MSILFDLRALSVKGTKMLSLDSYKTVADIRNQLETIIPIEPSSYKILMLGREVDPDTELVENGMYSFIPRVFGGKGGFGSMLRAIGAQIEKTTNREACRDLSGRRMRDVNNEKKLKDWISKKADREKERDRIRRERLARRLAQPKHNFDDPNYEMQKSQAAESLEDALQKGLKKSKASSTVTTATLGKRAGSDEEAGPSKSKVSRKSLEWMGVEVGSDVDSDLSDSDTDNSIDNNTASIADSVSSLTKHDESSEKEGASTSSMIKCEQSGTEMEIPNDETKFERSFEKPTETSSEPTQLPPVEAKKGSLLSMLPPVKMEHCKSEQNGSDNNTDDVAPIDLTKFDSSSQLESLGLDVLKAELLSRGLKCGGTLQQRAERLFSVKGLNQNEIPSSLLAKSGGKKSGKKTN